MKIHSLVFKIEIALFQVKLFSLREKLKVNFSLFYIKRVQLSIIL